MRSCLSALACLAVAACAEPEHVADPVAYANPFMGTGGFGFTHGSAFPGACAPNGLVKVGPDTSGRLGTFIAVHYSGYWAEDDTVQGFSHLHLHGTGATDGGVLSLMPVPSFGPAQTRVSGYASKFDKASETASPGYYAVTLDNGRIRTELTATTHAAHHRITYGEPGERWVLFDLSRILAGGKIVRAEATLVPGERRVSGVIHAKGEMSDGFGGYLVHFEARTKDAWSAQRVWGNDGMPAEGDRVTSPKGGFALKFDGDRAELQVGVSLVSAEGARRNLDAEMPAFDFDATRARTEAAWRERLSRLVVYGGSEDERRTFYSGAHHAFLMPTVISDVDGAFTFAGKSGQAAGFRMLSDFSLWDTYRTLHPFYALAAPDLAAESVSSLTEMAKARGGYPRWPLLTGETGVMLGASADIVIADAYLKGVRGFDVDAAWSILRAAALDANPPNGRGARDSFDHYLTHGWVPSTEDGRSVSKTTEYAHADFALAQLAAALGKADDAARLLARSRGYRALWDPAHQVLRSKKPDGSAGRADFNPGGWDDFAEANAWQSVWMAPHDLDGLAGLFGGRPAFVAALEAFFDKSVPETATRRANPEDIRSLLPPDFYWAGNEPDIQAPFLFAQAGRPDLTAKWSAWARREFFGPGPEGLPGNDDGGSMGTWFVFAALGIYPLPGSDLWIVGSPLFPKVELAVKGGIFTIEAPDVSAENLYVQSATLNGEPLTKALLRHADLKAGGALVLEMGIEPGDWGR